MDYRLDIAYLPLPYSAEQHGKLLCLSKQTEQQRRSNDEMFQYEIQKTRLCRRLMIYWEDKTKKSEQNRNDSLASYHIGSQSEL